MASDEIGIGCSFYNGKFHVKDYSVRRKVKKVEKFVLDYLLKKKIFTNEIGDRNVETLSTLLEKSANCRIISFLD